MKKLYYSLLLLLPGCGGLARRDAPITADQIRDVTQDITHGLDGGIIALGFAWVIGLMFSAFLLCVLLPQPKASLRAQLQIMLGAILATLAGLTVFFFMYG